MNMLLLIISAAIMLVTKCDDKKLIYVLQFLRHGHRKGNMNLLNDTDHYDKRLTKFGKREHQILGSQKRSIYIEQQKLIGQNLMNSELYVYSSNFERTMNSAQSYLLGLYPMGCGPSLPKGLNSYYTYPAWENRVNDGIPRNNTVGDNEPALPKRYQPIPIHTDRIDREYILRHFDENICPTLKNFTEIKQEQFGVINLKKTYQQLKKYFKGLQQQTIDENNVKLWYIWDISDNIRSLDVEEKLKNDYLEDTKLQLDIEFINNYAFYYLLFNSENDNHIWIMSPVINELFRQFDKKLKGQTEQKMRLYFGHQETISGLLQHFGFASNECIQKVYEQKKSNQQIDENCEYDSPRYAASFGFEIYEETIGEETSLSVKIVYNDRVMREMEYGQFVKQYNMSISDEEYLKKCGNMQSQLNQVGSLMKIREQRHGGDNGLVAVGCVLLVLVIVASLVIIGISIQVKALKVDNYISIRENQGPQTM